MRSIVGLSRRTALCTVALGLAPRWAHAQSPELSVHIAEPSAGIIDGDLSTTLTATVSDASIRTALLTVNGLSYPVPVEDGSITQEIVVTPGNNRIAVTVCNETATARDSMTFFFRGTRLDFTVVLGWASQGEIIDLWVREPSGETCKWDHRSTASGGRLLDFSANAIGFGSQSYALPTVSAGRFRVKVHYWSARAEEDDRGEYAYREMLDRVDQLDEMIETASVFESHLGLRAERERLLARLDRWSLPAAPQTPVHAEVVLFPNRTCERRWRFDLITQRTGQLITLGEVEVTDAMIREARTQDAR